MMKTNAWVTVLVAAILLGSRSGSRAELCVKPCGPCVKPCEPVCEEHVPEEKILSFYDRHLPELARHIRDLGKRGCDEYARALEEAQRHMRDYHAVRKDAPDIAGSLLSAYGLEHDARVLAGTINKTADREKRKRMTCQLSETIGKMFDLRLLQAQAMIRRHEREVRKITVATAKRKAARDEIVAALVRDLLADPPAGVCEW